MEANPVKMLLELYQKLNQDKVSARMFLETKSDIQFATLSVKTDSKGARFFAPKKRKSPSALRRSKARAEKFREKNSAVDISCQVNEKDFMCFGSSRQTAGQVFTSSNPTQVSPSICREATRMNSAVDNYCQVNEKDFTCFASPLQTAGQVFTSSNPTQVSPSICREAARTNTPARVGKRKRVESPTHSDVDTSTSVPSPIAQLDGHMSPVDSSGIRFLVENTSPCNASDLEAFENDIIDDQITDIEEKVTMTQDSNRKNVHKKVGKKRLRSLFRSSFFCRSKKQNRTREAESAESADSLEREQRKLAAAKDMNDYVKDLFARYIKPWEPLSFRDPIVPKIDDAHDPSTARSTTEDSEESDDDDQLEDLISLVKKQKNNRRFM